MTARPRRIVFRLEFGTAAGWGHLARCSALAAELRARGWKCVAWIDGRLDTAPEDLRAPFSEVIAAGSDWAEHPPAEVRGAGWIVVDDYRASDEWLGALHQAAPDAGLFVIDDEAARTLEAVHIVLNPRLGLERSPYAAGVMALLGERYALLRGALRAPAKMAARFASHQVPVLVMLGGTDPRGLTAVVLNALADVDASRFVPVVVRRRVADTNESMTRALQRFAAGEWLDRVDAPTLAAWANVCHYAVSACGGTLYELAFLGLPFVGVSVAVNQRAFAAEVSRRWHLPVVDADAGDVRGSVAAAMRSLVANHPAAAAGMSPRPSIGGMDGLGAMRVADMLDSR